MNNFISASTITNERGVMNSYDCGCLIHRSSCGAHLILACNLHNNASVLLEALQALVTQNENINAAFYGSGTRTAMRAAMEGQKELLQNARAAIKIASTQE